MENSLEKRGKKRARRRDIRRALLTAVKISAVLGLAITAPKVITALHKTGIVDFNPSADGAVARTRRQLIAAGFLARNENGLLRLTQKGSARLARLEARELVHKKPRRWDGRWRVLIFDVPEHRRSLRNKLRRTLLSVGFLRLQDSVWIYPYDCEDFILLLKADFRIGKDVLYMVVDELESDRDVRTHFGLPKR